MTLHRSDPALARLAVEHISSRQVEGAPLGGTTSARRLAEELATALPSGIPALGVGAEEAWTVFQSVVDRNTIGLDSNRFLAFIPMAPSSASVWMDAVVGASSYSAESWLEAAGAVAAENQVLGWLAGLAGLPGTAGGCFMSGGSIGNLSALTVARDNRPGRRTVLVADTAHASNVNACSILGLDIVSVATDDDGRMTATGVRAALAGLDDPHQVGIVIASAGSTNAGLIDDLGGIADVATEIGAWLHVDGAYGGAALLLEEFSARLAGLARADSFIVDPHKWLFATAGSCALLYREPALARAVHAQHGPYIDILRDSDGDELPNPCDLGFQLTRRASGLPLWFSLIANGVDAHAAGVRRGIELARLAAAKIEAHPETELVTRPELSVVLFRRAGWAAEEWSTWSSRLLAAGVAFAAPTTWRGESVGRLVFLHPDTTESIVDEVLAATWE